MHYHLRSMATHLSYTDFATLILFYGEYNL